MGKMIDILLWEGRKSIVSIERSQAPPPLSLLLEEGENEHIKIVKNRALRQGWRNFDFFNLKLNCIIWEKNILLVSREMELNNNNNVTMQFVPHRGKKLHLDYKAQPANDV